MPIVTKKGDKGKTHLFSGEEVPKSSARLEAYGTIDELVSFMGLARSLCKDTEVANHLLQYQKILFRLGTELSTCLPAGTAKGPATLDPIGKNDVEAIDMLINEYESKINLAKGFVIPGSNSTSGSIDVARTVCRRLERILVGLAESGEWKSKEALVFINRLSDLLFLMARKEE